LTATEEDINAEIERLAERSERSVEELKKEIGDRKGYEFLTERISMDKALDFLGDKAKIKTESKKKDDVDESSSDSD
jgi:FKBP-type peptidyl-prolyl cis-trans isomerase (trigger factor)